jgi:hypothetical protein
VRDEEELADEARRSREETERLRQESAVERDGEPEPGAPGQTATDPPSEEKPPAETSSGETAE